MDIKAHLKTLTELPGPSGYEDRVREALQQAWGPLTNGMTVGRSGSLSATKRGTQPESPHRLRILIEAHMDENALVVNNILDGFLTVKHIGGPDERVLPGTPVIVYGKPHLRGVIGVRPLRSVAPDDQGNYLTLQQVFVDLALPAAEVAAQVSVGDLLVPDLPMLELQNNRLAGKAMDDRSCVAILTLVLDMLQSRTHVWDVVALAATQEETGLHGAEVEAYREFPDLAIALDVTFGAQPGGGEPTFKLGGGPSLGIGPNFHPALYEAMLKSAEALDITVHPEAIPNNSGTDAWAMQIAREGVPCALVGLPTRNMHTAVETVDVKDMERTARWLAEFIAGLPLDFMEHIVWDKDDEKNHD